MQQNWIEQIDRIEVAIEQRKNRMTLLVYAVFLAYSILIWTVDLPGWLLDIGPFIFVTTLAVGLMTLQQGAVKNEKVLLALLRAASEPNTQAGRPEMDSI